MNFTDIYKDFTHDKFYGDKLFVNLSEKYNQSFTGISCTSYHSLLLTKTNEVMTCGEDGYYKLNDLKDVISIDGGDNFSLFLLRNGDVYKIRSGFFDVNPSPPKKIDFLPSIISIACGTAFSLFLNENGYVYSKGWNIYGQLGVGDYERRRIPQKLIETPPISSIYCTKYSSLMLDFDGRLWVCGRNDYGQLGLGDTIDRCIPTEVIGLGVVTFIFSGGNHVILKSTLGTFTFGKDIGQVNSSNNIVSPQIVEKLDKYMPFVRYRAKSARS